MSSANEIGRMARAARSAGRRLKLRRGLTALAGWLPVPLGYAALVVGAAKVLPLSLQQARPWLWGGLVPVGFVVVMALRAAFTRRAAFEGALALDRHHGLE